LNIGFEHGRPTGTNIAIPIGIGNITKDEKECNIINPAAGNDIVFGMVEEAFITYQEEGDPNAKRFANKIVTQNNNESNECGAFARKKEYEWRNRNQRDDGSSCMFVVGIITIKKGENPTYV